jgi:RNA polymerase sigma-70 factor (ECF subfamily)
MEPRADADLIARLQRGEAAAFDEAYARYRDRIFSFLWRLAGRREVAEDLFQETWLKLARSATSLRDDTELGAWLFAVARNQWRSHQRWHLTDADGLRHVAEAPSSAADPAGRVEARGDLDALEAALRSLPTAAREVLLLVGVEGMSPEQAAQVIGIETDAVRQRLSRARAQLAEALSGAGRKAAGASR